jgi:hypothetical protein
MEVAAEEKKELLVLLVPLELVAILTLQKIVVDAQDVQVDILKEVVGVGEHVIDDKSVTGGVIVGGKIVNGHITELVPEPM